MKSWRSVGLVTGWQLTASLAFYAIFAATAFVRDTFGVSRAMTGVAITAIMFGYTALLFGAGAAVDGYGELFRQRSLDTIGTSTIQSRAVAGLIDRTLVFAMPGSPKACATAWDGILAEQLDARTRPCNFVAMVLPQSSPCVPRQATSDADVAEGAGA
jgi:hypothetical protein